MIWVVPMNSPQQPPFNLNLKAKAQGAFLAAAAGDALGWPQEDRSHRVSPRNSRNETHRNQFVPWVRRGGGRFYPHEEEILPGEYSDDTQLLLCVARSRLHGPSWWEHLVRRELPTWSLYERGGGGATKRAVDVWASGIAPWGTEAKRPDRARYFQAGGNGVAMRIAPHCVLGARSDDFDRILIDFILDGIATHGHPRALVGAAAYGFALWSALRQTETLAYGDLIRRTIEGAPRWSRLPDEAEYPDLWRMVADESTDGSYEGLWKQTVSEMVSLLEVAEKGLKLGALSVEREVLEDLGTVDRRVNGAGTVSAAAAIFLASRYAADPLNGIIEAAHLKGADTDTIASMTGALLGGLVGSHGMKELFDELQDAPYIRHLADELATCDVTEFKTRAVEPVTRSDLQRFIKLLKEAGEGDSVQFPDGRQVTINRNAILRSRTGATAGKSWRLLASDDQSLYVKSLSRSKDSPREYDNPPDQASPATVPLPHRSVTCRVKILVEDLGRAASFYSEVLGLTITKNNLKYVNLSDVLILVTREYEAEMVIDSAGSTAFPKPTVTIVSLGVPSLGAVHQRLERVGARMLTRVVNRSRHSFLRCLDPDGNIVEVFEL